jgi:hypothetical protein
MTTTHLPLQDSVQSLYSLFPAYLRRVFQLVVSQSFFYQLPMLILNQQPLTTWLTNSMGEMRASVMRQQQIHVFLGTSTSCKDAGFSSTVILISD